MEFKLQGKNSVNKLNCTLGVVKEFMDWDKKQDGKN